MTITKEVSITYREQTKDVVPTVKVSYIGPPEELPSNEEILKEEKDLFNKARSTTKSLAMQKMIPSHH